MQNGTLLLYHKLTQAAAEPSPNTLPFLPFYLWIFLEYLSSQLLHRHSSWSAGHVQTALLRVSRINISTPVLALSDFTILRGFCLMGGIIQEYDMGRRQNAAMQIFLGVTISLDFLPPLSNFTGACGLPKTLLPFCPLESLGKHLPQVL